MPATAITLVPSTTHGTATGNYDGSSTDFYSDSAKADGYYGYADGFHTVSWHVTSLVGKITIQASLVESPTDTDCFDVQLVGPDNSAYTEQYDGSTAQTFHKAYNFTGNFVWVRAIVSNWTDGSVQSVLLNH